MGQCVARDLGLGNVDKTLKETTLYKKMHERLTRKRTTAKQDLKQDSVNLEGQSEAKTPDNDDQGSKRSKSMPNYRENQSERRPQKAQGKKGRLSDRNKYSNSDNEEDTPKDNEITTNPNVAESENSSRKIEEPNIMQTEQLNDQFSSNTMRASASTKEKLHADIHAIKETDMIERVSSNGRSSRQLATSRHGSSFRMNDTSDQWESKEMDRSNRFQHNQPVQTVRKKFDDNILKTRSKSPISKMELFEGIDRVDFRDQIQTYTQNAWNYQSQLSTAPRIIGFVNETPKNNQSESQATESTPAGDSNQILRISEGFDTENTNPE